MRARKPSTAGEQRGAPTAACMRCGTPFVPSNRCSSAIPFEVWLFTVPTETPRASAVSFSDRSNACRSTTQARLRNGSLRNASWTSTTPATSGFSVLSSRCDQNRAMRRRSRTALRMRVRAMFATTPRAYAAGWSAARTRSQRCHSASNASAARSSAVSDSPVSR
ncbi:hypothetical protein SPURM210S_02469 [Streptomyces purpurascens]